MSHNFEEIVSNWYSRFRPTFMNRLTHRYPSMSLEVAKNLYQDTFIAIYDNLLANRVKENTSWSSYIMTIGLNLANKAMRKSCITDSIDEEDDERVNATAYKMELLSRALTEDNLPLSEDLEVQALLGNELTHTPEPCASIIRLFYYEDMRMDEIATEIGYKNAQTTKAKKSQCMTDLIKRVTDSLNRAGFDIRPKIQNKNG